jgi:hypothetical protein
MFQGFKLFSIELHSSNSELLLRAPHEFSDDAETVYFNRRSGKLVMQFISTANEEQIEFVCDEFKKEIESGGGDHLAYKITITEL